MPSPSPSSFLLNLLPHILSMSYYSSTLLPQHGAHPVSTTHIHLAGAGQLYDSCTLHLYYILPPILFVDTHELTQRGLSYSFHHWGSRDLEKPVHAISEEPSQLLVNVQPPVNHETTAVEVPMHIRYGVPSNNGKEEYWSFEISQPQAFLCCPTSCMSYFKFVVMYTNKIVQRYWHKPIRLLDSQHISCPLFLYQIKFFYPFRQTIRKGKTPLSFQ